MTALFHCRYARLSELPLADAQTAALWLSPSECRYWDGISAPSRRATWLAGRIVAKRLLQEFATSGSGDVRPSDWHIESRTTDGSLGERPRVWLAGKPLSCGLSIAHTVRGALAVLTADDKLRVGADLVDLAQMDSPALAWSFTSCEKEACGVSEIDSALRARVWAMKEALFKAGQAAPRFAPSQIDVLAALACRDQQNLKLLQSWHIDGHVAAVAVAHIAETVRAAA